ncbi:hypothetical protein LCGC14_1448600 [marine sediment metagenome]|uniref:Uncharacterized protein n=1 Tax=marine sediment metagenome TaxID=412755 RepID=A0A0F9JIG8_9ZZZZ
MYLNFSILGRTLSFKIVNDKVFNISFLIVKKPDKETYGVTSRCFDGSHSIFLDYDGLTFEEMTDELENIIYEFGLSSFYIFKNDTDKSFHAICLDKFRMYEAMDIISYTSADKGFKKAPILFKQRRWVLRVSPKGKRKKPEYLATIKSDNNAYEKSTAHRIFLEANYNMKIGKLKMEDGFDEFIDICRYNTGANC